MSYRAYHDYDDDRDVPPASRVRHPAGDPQGAHLRRL